ncbi:hypothetical protein ACJIZ3_021071 [Penstemon smallii]|uniref:Leucine-rich repeat-containing N-terminal plant-type domain-containing protein n=1 Tax=Penstemon smallii TaxID=265156 RepID=A0ABD3SKM8_9LAMI
MKLIIVLIAISCFVHTCQGTCNQLDRDSLSSFNLSISTTSPLNWSLSIDCCTWEGVGCDDSGRVTNLWLPSRGLQGSISPSIVNLNSLSQFNLSHNSLVGPLPDGFFVSLKRLQVIDLSRNRLSGKPALSDKLSTTIHTFNLSSNHFHGTIQSSFLQTTLNLETFDVSNNDFSGVIPSIICTFSSSIQSLDFSNNDFTGPIPQGFGQCTELQSFRAGFSNLSGEVPQDIYRLLMLQELYLPGNRLSGKIDKRIVNLSNLKILALYGNELTGMIPQDIGRLSRLERLQLHINQLEGTIPPSLTNCKRLTTLNLRVNSLEVDLGNNFFTGRLPTSLFSCKTLKAIRLASNELIGEILPNIVELQSLSLLSLSNNSLTNIKSAIKILTGCKNLSTLILSKNFYDEELPSNESLIDPEGFQNLQVLALGGCRFTGAVPMWLLKLDKLEVIDLSFNNITGSIPGWIGILPNLFYLDLSHNLLSGYFPMELSRLRRLGSQQNSDEVNSSSLELPVFVQPNNVSNLQYNQLSNLPPAIYLGNNNIGGTIPVEIGQLKFIISLDLSNNNFSGTIPDKISNLTNLEKLDLSGNQLTGQIPASLQNLNFLSEFSVAYNNLEGPIPGGGQFDTFPSSSFEGNPRLCGRILQRSCLNPHVNEPRDPEEKDDIINWLSFGIGYGVSLIVTMLAVFKRSLL